MNPFIQILHDGRSHWVTVSTIACDPGEINYYHSPFKGKIIAFAYFIASNTDPSIFA